MKKSQTQNKVNTTEIQVAALEDTPVRWGDKMEFVRSKIDEVMDLLGIIGAEDDLGVDKITDQERRVLGGVQEALYKAHNLILNAESCEDNKTVQMVWEQNGKKYFAYNGNLQIGRVTETMAKTDEPFLAVSKNGRVKHFAILQHAKNWIERHAANESDAL